MKYSLLLLLAFMLGLAACGKNEEKPAESVFKTQTDALEKAKQVEQIIQQQDIEQRRQMDEQSR